MSIANSTGICLGLGILISVALSAAEPAAPKKNPSARMSTQELAQWIDQQLEVAWKEAGVEPPAIVDDATFLKRCYLDLIGSIPSVSQTRDFFNDKYQYKREALIDRMLNDTRRPEKYGERTAAYWATLWRRMMVPGRTPEAMQAVALEPWIKEQLAANVPYDDLARKLVTASTDTPTGTPTALNMPNAAGGPAMFYQVIGGKPENAASSLTRIFLGVRIGCAECHDHPFANWKQKDFWGMAAFFSGVGNGVVGDSGATKIKPQDSEIEYAALYLGAKEPQIPAGQTPRQALAEWMVSPENTQFAATAVNRIWMYLLGRGLTTSVDDLDQASPSERRILDRLAEHFVTSGYDVRWLIAGICKSQVYQRDCLALEDADDDPPPGIRVVKTLTPEQVFNSLEQSLALPVARVDGSARFNGLRDQLIARMNEAMSNSPTEFQAGIPQALLLMNGRLTTEATDLETSRTLRGVLDAPFLNTDEKLTTLYLATFCRPPRDEEKQFLMNHIREAPDDAAQKRAYAEIFWGLLNSPEFVLER